MVIPIFSIMSLNTISLPIDLSIWLCGCASGRPTLGRPGSKAHAGVYFHRPGRYASSQGGRA
jgi:hypothetical protein